MNSAKLIVKSAIVSVLGSAVRPYRMVRGLGAGYRIYISPAEHLGYLFGRDEPRLQRAIKNYVAAGDTVYDIGANIGYISLSLAKCVGDSGEVIAFEPVPRNFDLLQKCVQLNKVRNIRLLNDAVADKSGETTIRITDNLSMASMVWHRNDPCATELPVRTTSIDELVSAGTLRPPKFVKIDVEGAEGLVLQGMRETLAVAKPVLFVECSDIGRETAWPLLCGLGYRCQSSFTGEWIDTFDKYRDVDFLWVPPELPVSVCSN
jgi:FkbM family methyltransferase